MGLHRVRHDCSDLAVAIAVAGPIIANIRADYGEGSGTLLQYSCLENHMDGGVS